MIRINYRHHTQDKKKNKGEEVKREKTVENCHFKVIFKIQKENLSS